jgi:hypothetical protein
LINITKSIYKEGSPGKGVAKKDIEPWTENKKIPNAYNSKTYQIGRRFTWSTLIWEEQVFKCRDFV